MASLVDYSTRYWVIRFKDATKHPKARDVYYDKSTSRSVMLDIRDDLTRQYVEGSYDPWETGKAEMQTIGDYIDEYVKDKSRRLWSKGTAKGYGYVFNNLKRDVGDREIGPRAIPVLESWVNNTAFRPESRKTYTGMVNSFLRWCAQAGVDVGKGKVSVWGRFQEEHNYVTHEQVLDLVSKIEPHDWLRDFLPFLFYTGMRIGEAMNITLSNIQDGWIVIGDGFDTKTKKQRRIPIDSVPGLREIVDRWVSKDRSREAIDMDATKSADKLFMHKDIKRASRRIKAHLRKHLGVENLKAHSFRHGCAVWLLTNGVDVYDVMKWLGHNRISTTERYVDLAPVDLARRVYDKMNQTPKLNPKSNRRKAMG